MLSNERSRAEWMLSKHGPWHNLKHIQKMHSESTVLNSAQSMSFRRSEAVRSDWEISRPRQHYIFSIFIRLLYHSGRSLPHSIPFRSLEMTAIIFIFRIFNRNNSRQFLKFADRFFPVSRFRPALVVSFTGFPVSRFFPSLAGLF